MTEIEGDTALWQIVATSGCMQEEGQRTRALAEPVLSSQHQQNSLELTA